MDLFGDLPEPSSKTNRSATTSLYVDVPAQKMDSSQLATSSLYADMPAQKTESRVSAANVQVSGEKRKLDENNSSLEKKQKTLVRHHVKHHLAERQGEREDMQDAHITLTDYSSMFTALHPSIYRLSLYGVFDGHGGVRASRFASKNLHKNLRDKFPKGDVTAVEKDIRKALLEAFKKTDEDFLREAGKAKPAWKDGTTVILLLIINETMYIANIGDSQAVLCRYKEETNSCTAVSLSVPHNPSIYEERMRIQKQGGNVKDGRVMGVLEVSRSIGDGQYKKLGVTCTPDVKKCQLTDNDRYVILACDGLWKCFEPKDSIEYVNKILGDTKDIVNKSSKRSEKFDTACNKLANEAVLRFSGDNVTVLILALTHSETGTT
ncbi:integrin-linked kinase-associated serine/threonine phosphatase 2C-like [Mya arenaria]|uniref:integrin-linked kinase-associated serine/threonine phosphatase 2C-like n=1 Tax=Mya arenaria TaxID=6604 RepID=UPI0022E744BF|nr:integrin-linked kinase-associated serine/threonine phosphatase 2C-like [Mya arenaria]XP_052819714.1 integrin-linked kinase-associated serine/threonine phosphatase 2C-like [Mya arenaria]